MDFEKARIVATQWAREQFGKMVEVREISVVRRASGRFWVASLYCMISQGDVMVGKIAINEKGRITRTITTDQMIDVLVTVKTQLDGIPFGSEASLGNADSFEDDFSDLSGDSADGGNGDLDLELSFDAPSPAAIIQEAQALLKTGEPKDLVAAIEVLPNLIPFQEHRGYALTEMGRAEILLGNKALGQTHLDAASRQYADIADVEGLASLAKVSTELLGEAWYYDSKLFSLINRLNIRLRPLEAMAGAPLFIGVASSQLETIANLATECRFEKDEIVIQEGAPAKSAFVIKEGHFSVIIETPGGENKIVRTCFPGDFVGETSILGDGTETCTATVQSRCGGSAWRFDGTALKSLCDQFPELLIRIQSAQTLHQLDAFLSTNKATSSMDATVRDNFLACIDKVCQISEGTVLCQTGEIPEAVYLISSGKIVLQRSGQVQRELESDTFAGLHDSLHMIRLEGDLVAATDCLTIQFSASRLREMAQAASPAVIAALEKMG